MRKLISKKRAIGDRPEGLAVWTIRIFCTRTVGKESHVSSSRAAKRSSFVSVRAVDAIRARAPRRGLALGLPWGFQG
jgi:hypothetical protein